MCHSTASRTHHILLSIWWVLDAVIIFYMQLNPRPANCRQSLLAVDRHQDQEQQPFVGLWSVCGRENVSKKTFVSRIPSALAIICAIFYRLLVSLLKAVDEKGEAIQLVGACTVKPFSPCQSGGQLSRQPAHRKLTRLTSSRAAAFEDCIAQQHVSVRRTSEPMTNVRCLLHLL